MVGPQRFNSCSHEKQLKQGDTVVQYEHEMGLADTHWNDTTS